MTFKTNLLASFFLIKLFCLSNTVFAQTVDSSNHDNSYVFRMIPSAKDNVYGIALGLLGSEMALV